MNGILSDSQCKEMLMLESTTVLMKDLSDQVWLRYDFKSLLLFIMASLQNLFALRISTAGKQIGIIRNKYF